MNLATTPAALTALDRDGYCVVKGAFGPAIVEASRAALEPRLATRLAEAEANRGPGRYFFPLPFEEPIFSRAYFFNPAILEIVLGILDDRAVADQWGCDVPAAGSDYQRAHQDYRRPLFPELPDLALPPYMLVLSFGLVPINERNGPLEIAPGTHRMNRDAALQNVGDGAVSMRPVHLDAGDALVRFPWTLHRGTPNRSQLPRPLASIRYVRRWYDDRSRDVASIPRALWDSFAPHERALLRFPVM